MIKICRLPAKTLILSNDKEKNKVEALHEFGTAD